nr:TRAM domain-containing protein [Clostridia bacterium]
RTTVMAGFPGETPEDFEELCDFVRDVRFDRLGCFAYSAEEGTVAAGLDGQISDSERRRRADLVMELQTSLLEARCESLIGQTLEVLAEAYDRYAERWFGRTVSDAPDIDCKVFFAGAPDAFRPGEFVPVRITETMDIDLIGEVASA